MVPPLWSSKRCLAHMQCQQPAHRPQPYLTLTSSVLCCLPALVADVTVWLGKALRGITQSQTWCGLRDSQKKLGVVQLCSVLMHHGKNVVCIWGRGVGALDEGLMCIAVYWTFLHPRYYTASCIRQNT